MTALFSLLAAIFNHDSVACFWWLLCLSYSGLSGHHDKCSLILALPRVCHIALLYYLANVANDVVLLPTEPLYPLICTLAD
jgi:hypothetical protein